MNDSVAFEARALRFKIYGRGVVRVDGVLRADDRLLVRGPSGCGKTTLLRTLAGLHPAESGALIIGGQDVTMRPPAERRLGMVFQDPALFPFLDVIGNVAFGLRYDPATRDLSEELRLARARAALDSFGLNELSTRPVGQLSGGEAQRVSALRSLVVEPRALLLDEPLSKLDAQNRTKLADWICQVSATRGTPLVIVSHHDDELAARATRVVDWPMGPGEQNEWHIEF